MRETTQAVTTFTRKHAIDKEEEEESAEEEERVHESTAKDEDKENYGLMEPPNASMEDSAVQKTAPLLVRCT